MSRRYDSLVIIKRREETLLQKGGPFISSKKDLHCYTCSSKLYIPDTEAVNWRMKVKWAQKELSKGLHGQTTNWKSYRCIPGTYVLYLSYLVLRSQTPNYDLGPFAGNSAELWSSGLAQSGWTLDRTLAPGLHGFLASTSHQNTAQSVAIWIRVFFRSVISCTKLSLCFCVFMPRGSVNGSGGDLYTPNP